MYSGGETLERLLLEVGIKSVSASHIHSSQKVEKGIIYFFSVMVQKKKKKKTSTSVMKLNMYMA